MAEAYYSLSSYNYCANSPILFIDPTGMITTHYVDEDYNTLGKTNDGNDGTVMIAQKYVSSFMSQYNMLSEMGRNDRKRNVDWIKQYGVGLSVSAMDKVPTWAISAFDEKIDVRGLMQSFAGFGLSVTEKYIKGATFRLFNKKGTNFSPKLYPSGWKGGSVGNIKVFGTKSIGKGLISVGYGLGVINGNMIYESYQSGSMSTLQFGLEEASNAVSTFGGLYGAAWGVGWELGRAITTIPGYNENVRVPLQKIMGVYSK